MTSTDNEIKIQKFFSILEKYISGNTDKYFSDYKNIREIRISVNKPMFIIDNTGIVKTETKNITYENIRNMFSALCEYSVHTYKNEICEGFITAEGGVRIGICGTAVYENGRISNIKDISALNIRIPHEFIGVSERITQLKNGGILIIGPPCSGKTTILRDYSRIVSKNKKLVVVDERTEISGIYRGIPSFDIGYSFVLNGFNKSDGMKIAVRSLSPEVIVCDEFCDENDVLSAIYAMKSGAEIVASMHAFDKDEFVLKPVVKKFFEHKIFSHFVFLDKNFKIKEILGDKEVFV